MASPDEVKDQTGYTIGGVSPIGHINSLQILVDSSLNRFKDLYAAAGHPNCIFKINFVDLLKLTNGSLEDIVE
jgi:prolyl-tRNA editing enzyme YbaK/EbsC (Cys-tRNA(Pro) deacylase)